MLVLMLTILSLLIVFVAFGCSFVCNMIVKRWWVGSAGYALVWIYVLYRTGFGLDRLEWLLSCLGCVGTLLACFGFRTLQRKGYKLFQRGTYTQTE